MTTKVKYSMAPCFKCKLVIALVQRRNALEEGCFLIRVCTPTFHILSIWIIVVVTDLLHGHVSFSSI